MLALLKKREKTKKAILVPDHCDTWGRDEVATNFPSLAESKENEMKY